MHLPGYRIHHIGVAVKDIAAAAAKYVRFHQYRTATEIIHDATQQAYVQFLRLEGDAAYLELVQPDGPDSNLSRAVAKGGGLNHICYSTDDIEAACSTLAGGGMFVITPPVPAVAFGGRRIAWLIGNNVVLTELVERGAEGEL